jgi:hypothetical protein
VKVIESAREDIVEGLEVKVPGSVKIHLNLD